MSKVNEQKVKAMVTCSFCEGIGCIDEHKDYEPCLRCGGTGIFPDSTKSIEQSIYNKQDGKK